MSDRPVPYSPRSNEPRSNPDPTQAQYQQPSLFELRAHSQPVVRDLEPQYTLSHQSLHHWKTRIALYQKNIRETLPDQQHQLFTEFSSDQNFVDNSTDPFSLKLYPEEFYRLPNSGQGEACIYFVIDFGLDLSLPLLLYIGETGKSHQRWQGIHDCKGYLQNYRHQHLDTSTDLRIQMTFDWQVPLGKRQRQKLELSYIQMWRSPFNKENWHWWQTPFIGIKN
jgi:hypothetical protein